MTHAAVGTIGIVVVVVVVHLLSHMLLLLLLSVHHQSRSLFVMEFVERCRRVDCRSSDAEVMKRTRPELWR